MNWGIRLLLVVFSAGLGITVFPPIGWEACALIAWLPLLFAMRAVAPAHAFYLGLVHGVVFYGVTMSWLVNVFVGAEQMMVPLVLIMSLFTAFFTRGYAVAQQRYGAGWVLAIFSACWWLTMEFYRSEIFYLKFPWMTPGLGLGPTCISPVLGVSGASFLIILAGALIFQKRRQCVTGGVMMVALLVLMLVQKNRPSPENAPVHVLAVQSEEFSLERYLELTDEALVKPDLVLWPEYALSYDVRQQPQDMKQLFALVRERNTTLIVGTQTQIGEGMSEWYNTALTLNENGILGEHYKNHTVHFFDDGVAGTEAKAVETSRWKIGTPICFDCDYQDVIRRMVADGAEFLAIPSMDGAHWGDKEHYQHAELFRHRAAENGRWVAVAATSGVTQIIDPYGNRVKSLPIIEEGVLTGYVGARQELTIYTRVGWLFPWCVTVAGALWMIVLFIQGLIGKRLSKALES